LSDKWIPALLKRLINGTLGLAGLRLVRNAPPATTAADVALRQMLSQLGITMVFDVGAHIGEYAGRLRQIGYCGRIISFEPQAAAFAVLATKAIGDPLWNAERAALANRVGEQELNISANSVSSSFLRVAAEMVEIETGLAQTKSETVPVTTLDHVQHRFVGPSDRVFLKIDAQGYELNILSGGDTFLTRCRAAQIEMALFPSYHEQKSLIEMIGFMHERGFRLVNLERVFWDDRTGYLIEVDGMFVRADDLPEALGHEPRGIAA